MDLPADLSRRLESLIRPGTIAEVDHDDARVRVASGGLKTDWLPWMELRAGETVTWEPPTVGEQCLVLSPSGDPALGVVLRGFYSNRVPAPSRDPAEHWKSFPDGAVIHYNHQTGQLEVRGIQSARLQAAVEVLVECPSVTINAADSVVVNCPRVTFNSETTTFTGDVEVKGRLHSHGVVLHEHVHVKVSKGLDNSGGPK